MALRARVGLHTALAADSLARGRSDDRASIHATIQPD